MMFQTEEEVLEKVKSVILSIPKEVFRKVYDEWILKLKAHIESNEDYLR